jgi:nicotinamidase-related amidase
VTPFPLRPERQALLVVDMQNDFLRVGAPQEVAEGRDIIPAIAGLVDAYRAARRPVLFTRFLAGPAKTLMTIWSPECGEEQRSCWPGHLRRYGDRPDELEGPAVVDELAPLPGETVVDKYGYGAFHSTVLRDALAACGCTQVVVVGVITQICVEDTVRQGFHHGLEMVVVPEGVASFDQELHDAALRNLGMKYAAVVPIDEVLRHLADGSAAREPGRG